jgi:hypothetical protein
MAAIALVARPRYVGIGLVIGVLLALLVVPPPEPRVPEARIEFGSWNLPKPEAGQLAIPPSKDVRHPPWTADAEDWPRGMVMGRHEAPIDRMDAQIVAHWLSGLLRWLASGAA